jgi:hypothetical protein
MTVRVCVLGVEEEWLRFYSLWVVCGARVLCFRVLVWVLGWVYCVFIEGLGWGSLFL